MKCRRTRALCWGLLVAALVVWRAYTMQGERNVV